MYYDVRFLDENNNMVTGHRATTIEEAKIERNKFKQQGKKQVHIQYAFAEKNVLYMNRLLAEGRNKFKGAIEAYNNSAIDNMNESLFGDKPTQADLFNTFIIQKLPEQTKKLIEKAQVEEVTPIKLKIEKAEKFNVGDIVLFAGQPVEIERMGSEKAGVNDIKGNSYSPKISDLKPAPQEAINKYIEKAYKPEYWQTKTQYKPMEQTHIINPNTDTEFDDAVMNNIQPHDDWKGNLIKERHILNQIVNQLTGDESEKESEAKRIFLLYAQKFPGQISETFSRQLNLSEAEALTDAAEITVDAEKKQPNTKNLLINDNWFELHPDKILGEPYTSSGRFGNVTKYRGKIDAVHRIDAPLNFMGISAAENPVLSAENESLSQMLIDPQSSQNIDAAIKETEKEILVSDKKRKSKAVKRIVSAGPIKDIDLISFEEVYNTYNPEINQDELQVYLWHKEQIGEKLSEKWYKLANYAPNTPAKKEWIKKGYLAYFRGELLPAYLYYAGNIWERKTALERDKKEIIELHGQDVFDNQKLQLDNIFKVSYDKRLLLTNPDLDKRLKILPISKFAETFTINSLTDGKEFKMKEQPAGGKNPGRPDFLYTGRLPEYKKTVFEKLSLSEAFQYWLINYAGEYEIKKDTDYGEIIRIYINQGKRPSLPKDATAFAKKEAEAVWQRKLNITKEEGDRLFSVFLSDWLNAEDIVRIETTWNEKFNGYLPINYNKIPVAFSHGTEYRGSIIDVRPEKREAVAFLMNEGAGCLAYDVGVGKTWSALFAIKQFMEAGYCKRPFICVPNQTYKQWLAEGKGLLPDVKFNDLYNLSKDYIEDLKGPNGEIVPVDEYSISVMTYEGLEQIGFSENTANSLLSEMHDILDQGDVQKSFKKQAKEQSALLERLQMLIGRGLKGTRLNIEDLGFDFACYDEAHKMKKVFVGVKGEMNEEGERDKNPYKIQSGGAPSSIALKGFMLSQYILRNNYNRNILLLTATPFTNSPLEVFSVLTFIAYRQLKETNLNNLKSFFDTYVNASNELVINAKLKPERKQVVMGFNNLRSLQQLIFRFINYKTGESVKVNRPNKYVLPYTKRVIDGEVIALAPEEQILTQLPLSPQQAAMMADIKAYAEGKLDLNAICSVNTYSDKLNADVDDDETTVDATEGIELDENTLNDDEKAGVRTLRSMSHARNLALSPYLYECSGLGTPNYKEYIESSPKLSYVIECVKSVKKWHEKNNTPVSGQVIYMDRGIEYFELIRQYLIKEVGYLEHEVGIIKSQMQGGKDAKENVKMKFLGEAYNQTGEVESIPDADRMKIVIGSSTIKEGINLQKHSTVLYNCFVDWNPTDIKQLEGRIWRQGNLFKNVRIVTPLMEDSMDIFIFQKLQEKTSRIAQLLEKDEDSNTFKLEEFNPSEIKAALVSDPYVLAEMELMEDKEKIADEIRGLKNEQTKIDKIIAAKRDYEDNIEEFKEFVEKYRPSKSKEPRSYMALLNAAQDVLKKQTDANGLPMEYSYSQKPNVKYSTERPVSKPYYFDTLMLANRTLTKAEKEYLTPKGLNIDKLPKYKESITQKVEELEEISKATLSEEAIKNRAEMIILKREREKIEPASVQQRVTDFERLNYLLADKKQIDAQAPKAACPPIDSAGILRTDKEALEELSICISTHPETKQMHTNKKGEYTEERKKLHEEIIAEVKKDVVCISQETPIAILTGGAPGSGKTYFLKNFAPYLLGPELFKIDADEIRAKLPEYTGWNSANAHMETRDIVNTLIDDIGKNCKYDLIYDGTMNKAKKYYDLINRLKNTGYDTYVIYIKVPQEVSEKRVLERYQRSGRFVPPDVLQEVYDNGDTAFNEIKSMVKGYILVDGVTGKIIEKGGEPIPTDRNYAKLSTTQDFTQKPEPKKKDYTDAIEGFKVMLEFAETEAEKLQLLEAIEGLEVLVEII